MTHSAMPPPTGAPYPYPAPLPVPTRPDPMPTEPVEYQHLTRGPLRRGWRPLLAAAVAGGGWIGVVTACTVVVMVAAYALGRDPSALLADPADPLGFGYSNVILALFIPAVMLSLWAAHRIRPGFASSVAGRLRWGWLLTCAAVIVPLWAAYLGLSWLVPGEDPTPTLSPERQWPILIALTLVTTPFQAAGEEYAFRGWLMQNLGAWFGNRAIALTLTALVSGTLFALAHGSLDVWILIDLIVFALVMTVLTWRTGGLEAAIAIHVVNNVMGLVLTIATGTLSEAFITTTTKGTPLQTAISVTVNVIAGALLLALARWRRVERLYSPGTTTPASSSLPASPDGRTAL